MPFEPIPQPDRAEAEEHRLARALCRTMADIHRRGWCDGTGGNFSCVLQRSPRLTLLMAPSGVDKGRVRADQLIVVDGDGRLLRGAGRPSAELALHREIVQRTGAGAVLHTHSQAATLLSRWRPVADPPRMVSDGGQMLGHLSLEGLEMLKGLEGITTHQCRIRIPVLSNDQDLGRLSLAARPHLADAPRGILIAGHGLYAWGADLPQAQRHLEILEFLLEQRWREALLHSISPLHFPPPSL